MGNASTARYGNESHGWCAPRYRSQRTWPIISELSNISFVTTTSPSVQHYQNSTTQSSTFHPLRLHPCAAGRPRYGSGTSRQGGGDSLARGTPLFFQLLNHR